MTFLAGFSGILLFDFHEVPHIEEYILMVYIFGMVVDEIRQVRPCKHHFIGKDREVSA